MKKILAIFFVCKILCWTDILAQSGFYPKNKATQVNPDAHLMLTFDAVPTLGTKGMIRIWDAGSHALVDSLDLSIPAGPTEKDTTRVPYMTEPYEYAAGHFTNANTKPGTPSGNAVANPDRYQLTIIGGFTDAFHFYPVIIHDKVATIYPHHNLLRYGKRYEVTIDAEVFGGPNGFKGIAPKQWIFYTKQKAPRTGSRELVVSADGSGDFDTVQGAIDFVPNNNTMPTTIFIKKGIYEEIVYFRKKHHVRFMGEDRENTVVTYTNDEPFNPHPANVATNELPGTFPSRRAAFMGDNCNDISIANLSIRNPSNKQAEGLLLTGERNMLYHVNVRGGGDALQVNGSVYIKESKIEGGGDMVLGRGAAFFEKCDLRSKYVFMWIRNTEANHGNVFVGCTFTGTGAQPTEIARDPGNKGKIYPYCEAVLIDCRLRNISAKGFGPVTGDRQHTRYWEHNSTNLSDGRPVDTSGRDPVVRQLYKEKDATTIANYRKPSFVLKGWRPNMASLEKAAAMFPGKQ